MWARRSFTAFSALHSLVSSRDGRDDHQPAHLARISLSPSTRFERICVSSALISAGTTASIIAGQGLSRGREVVGSERSPGVNRNKMGKGAGVQERQTTVSALWTMAAE